MVMGFLAIVKVISASTAQALGFLAIVKVISASTQQVGSMHVCVLPSIAQAHRK